MICPACAGEFVDGVIECPDCLVGLVAPSDPDSSKPVPQADHWQTVWTVESTGELDVVSALLEASGIPVNAPGKTIFGLILRYRQSKAPDPSIGPPREPDQAVCEVQVPSSRAEEALAILQAEPEAID